LRCRFQTARNIELSGRIERQISSHLWFITKLLVREDDKTLDSAARTERGNGTLQKNTRAQPRRSMRGTERPPRAIGEFIYR
jgi:hypothetical protein